MEPAYTKLLEIQFLLLIKSSVTFILEMIFKKKFQAVIFTIWSLPAIANAQDTCVYLFTMEQKADFVTADHLSNSYLLHGFEVEKYDSTGRFVSRYSNNRFGMPGFLDASNPLKILVWYADFQTAVFLDRNMTELGRLNVADVGWPSVATIAMASDGNLWIYDLASFKLLKISTSGEKVADSEPLNFVHDIDASISISSIRDNGERVYVGFRGLGMLSFDIFGQNSELQTFDRSFSQFEIVGNYCISLNQDRIGIQEIGTFNYKERLFPKSIPVGKSYWISKKRLFVQIKSGVAVYGF